MKRHAEASSHGKALLTLRKEFEAREAQILESERRRREMKIASRKEQKLVKNAFYELGIEYHSLAHRTKNPLSKVRPFCMRRRFVSRAHECCFFTRRNKRPRLWERPVVTSTSPPRLLY